MLSAVRKSEASTLTAVGSDDDRSPNCALREAIIAAVSSKVAADFPGASCIKVTLIRGEHETADPTSRAALINSFGFLRYNVTFKAADGSSRSGYGGSYVGVQNPRVDPFRLGIQYDSAKLWRDTFTRSI